MATVPPTFRTAAVSPIEDVSEGWRRIRDVYWLFLGIACVGVLIGSFAPMGVLMGPMMCGIYGCYRHRFQGRPVRFEMLFEGFDTHTFVQSLVATLILMGVSFVVVFGVVIVGFLAALALGVSLAAKSGEPASGLVATVMVLVLTTMMTLMVVVGTLFAFVYPLIVDRRMKGVEAVMLSVRAALANLGGLLGLSLVTFVMGLAGMCCCYVGAFFVMPISLAAHMVAYEQVFGLTAPSEQPPLPRVADDAGKIEP
jgi:hypothetical protein